MDGDALAASPSGERGSGTAVVNDGDGTLTFTPALNFTGIDKLQLHGDRRGVESNAATVTVTVTAVNDAPVAVR